MLGIYRYLLAVVVVGCHLWLPAGWWAAPYAVFCFYSISGYLMTLVLNQVYVNHSDNVNYVANRILRIFPPYLVALILTVLALTLFSSVAPEPVKGGVKLANVVSTPGSLQDWFANMTFLYWGESRVLAVSQAWTLRVELFFYVLMIFLVRRAWLVYAWLALSACYIVYMKMSGAQFMEQYSTLSGSSIAFAVGASIYHLRKQFNLPRWHLPLALVLFSVHMALASEIWGFVDEGLLFRLVYQPGACGLYVNVLLGGYLLFAMQSWPVDKNSWIERIGKPLGDFSYGIYLLHWLVALLVVAAGISISQQWLFIPIHFVTVHVAAYMLYRTVELPIDERFRGRIRGRSKLTGGGG